MSINIEQNISTLLKNFVESGYDVELVFLYNREGLLISKFDMTELSDDSNNKKNMEEVYGAISGLVENLFKKISMEYNLNNFGTGSFDTPDHRIIFLEAGPEAVMVCVCNYKADLNSVFPIAYLVVEKIAQLLEGTFDYKFNSLEIPELNIYREFDIFLEKYKVKESEPLAQDVILKHHISREKKVDVNFKLIILGSASVGKTTLVNSFLNKEQKFGYRPTIGMNISMQKYCIQGFKDEIITFLIYDYAGQEFFKRVRHEYYTGANCVFIVYDISRRETFDESIDFWFKDAKKELGDIPFVIIGNKVDLESKRQISIEEGKKKAEELRSFFIETSALYNKNVIDTFKLIGIGHFFKVLDES
ncbi:MAG: GTP-binding protein [Candidatus Lokiarchaeota archaeon]|nr:GTP-binding protein [Candidatus Lokiarchaeota archaeon]